METRKGRGEGEERTEETGRMEDRETNNNRRKGKVGGKEVRKTVG